MQSAASSSTSTSSYKLDASDLDRSYFLPNITDENGENVFTGVQQTGDHLKAKLEIVEAKIKYLNVSSEFLTYIDSRSAELNALHAQLNARSKDLELLSQDIYRRDQELQRRSTKISKEIEYLEIGLNIQRKSKESQLKKYMDDYAQMRDIFIEYSKNELKMMQAHNINYAIMLGGTFSMHLQDQFKALNNYLSQ